MKACMILGTVVTVAACIPEKNAADAGSAPVGCTSNTDCQPCAECNACEEAVCVAATGQCQVQALADGLYGAVAAPIRCFDGELAQCLGDDDCVDTTACTEESCVAGHCEIDDSECQCNLDQDCIDLNPCTDSGCNSKSHLCFHQPALEGQLLVQGGYCLTGQPVGCLVSSQCDTDGPLCEMWQCEGHACQLNAASCECSDAAQCADDRLCSVDICNSERKCETDTSACSCLIDADCDNHADCDVETCVGGNCTSTPVPNGPAPSGAGFCLEGNWVECYDNIQCGGGVGDAEQPPCVASYCDAEHHCQVTWDTCECSDANPCADTGEPCRTRTCNPATATCQDSLWPPATPCSLLQGDGSVAHKYCDAGGNCAWQCVGTSDCSNGQHCDGEETCSPDSHTCAPGHSPCKAGECCSETGDPRCSNTAPINPGGGISTGGCGGTSHEDGN